MVVDLYLKLAENTPFPVELSFLIPENAQVQTVASQSGEDSQYPLEHDITTSDSWQVIQLTASSPEILIAYYDLNLTEENAIQRFEYEWLSFYACDSLEIIIQQPSTLSSLASNPALNLQSDETTGALTYAGEMGAVEAEKSWSLLLKYTNPAAFSTPSSAEVSPAMPIDGTTAGRSSSPLTIIVGLLIAAVIILIVLGLYYWWFRTNVAKRQTRIVQDVETQNPEKAVIFCHECGMLSQTGDGYCRNCGTQLRKVGKFSPPPDL